MIMITDLDSSLSPRSTTTASLASPTMKRKQDVGINPALTMGPETSSNLNLYTPSPHSAQSVRPTYGDKLPALHSAASHSVLTELSSGQTQAEDPPVVIGKRQTTSHEEPDSSDLSSVPDDNVPDDNEILVTKRTAAKPRRSRKKRSKLEANDDYKPHTRGKQDEDLSPMSIVDTCDHTPPVQLPLLAPDNDLDMEKSHPRREHRGSRRGPEPDDSEDEIQLLTFIDLTGEDVSALISSVPG
jgi:hypothetical protein